MDFTKIGSLSGYINNVKMQQKWNIKKESGDILKKEDKRTDMQKKNDVFLQAYKEQQKNTDTDEMLNTIHTKMNSGIDLTEEEKRYLQTKDPAAYQKIRNEEIEQKKYERELKRCKTKEEVQRLKTSKINGALSTINSVKNNPNIPEGVKVGIFADVQRRMNNMQKIEAEFVKSGKYAKLPDENEVNKVKQDLKTAEENENNKISEDKENVKTESYENDEITVSEAENTPEARKVKRAKAINSYSETEKYSSEAFGRLTIEKNK